METNYIQEWTYLVKWLISNCTKLAIQRTKNSVYLNVVKNSV